MKRQTADGVLRKCGAAASRVGPKGLGVIALACLVCVVFWPIVGFEFVYLDVPAAV